MKSLSISDVVVSGYTLADGKKAYFTNNTFEPGRVYGITYNDPNQARLFTDALLGGVALDSGIITSDDVARYTSINAKNKEVNKILLRDVLQSSGALKNELLIATLGLQQYLGVPVSCLSDGAYYAATLATCVAAKVDVVILPQLSYLGEEWHRKVMNLLETSLWESIVIVTTCDARVAKSFKNAYDITDFIRIY